MEVGSVISLVEHAAGGVLRSRSGSRAERARLYVAFQERALAALVELEFLQAFGNVYRHPVGSFWTWPHLLRTTDANKESLKQLLIALSALETMRCPAATVGPARAFVEQLVALSSALQRPRWWQPGRRQESEQRWDAARATAYALHEDYQQAVVRDLHGRRWLRRLPVLRRWA